MSRAYVTLAVTCVVTVGIVAFVHLDQERQLARMRQGVFADALREQSRRDAMSPQNQPENSHP